ncbi:hypothetical protein MNEG_5119 [Monoraphidium neglectum]|uniref:Uncharacterized protein n=1 Tax=Monoraphidium neglectum TaxID=145388 RepID=A0A0D2NBH7_9CHLO|nr:hypothetical protein MNEG_5119 [Monoraphidium neglectum]KIZ02841.1 hypothetical protein MNEG_5119 [Monoraphidium neglectum]|eukprot:XP_013901860.1 hypothetical protein MNEG_5119 [Monoraphidium neglectum]
MFAECKASQCYPKLLGLVASTPVGCLPYVNSCGAGAAFCSTGSSCVGGACVAGPGATSSGGGGATATPQQACAAARAQQHACSADRTPLVAADGAKLGYGVPDGAECYESASFKCCAVASSDAAAPQVASIVQSCKGAAIFESAVAGLVNGTTALLNSVFSAGNNTTAAAAPGAAGGQQPALLTPLLQGVAGMVTNMSQALLAPLGIRVNSTSPEARAARAAAPPPPPPSYLQYVNSASPRGSFAAALVGSALLLALAL